MLNHLQMAPPRAGSKVDPRANPKLPPPEAGLLVNFKIYVTRSDDTLSDNGILVLAKMPQLQNLLCRVARVCPTVLEKTLAGPMEIIKMDKERREMEAIDREDLVDDRRGLRRALGEDSATEGNKRTKKRRKTKKNAVESPAPVAPMVVENQSDGDVPGGSMQTTQNHLAAGGLFDDTMSDVGSDHGDDEEDKENARDTSKLFAAARAQMTVSNPNDNSQGNNGAGASTPANRQNTEILLCSQDPQAIAQLSHYLTNVLAPLVPRRIFPEKISSDIEAILIVCQKLNFDTIKYKLLEFADRRQKIPGSRARVTDLADAAEPFAIFNAIQVSAANEVDAKLHRIYGQLRLVRSVDAKVVQLMKEAKEQGRVYGDVVGGNGQLIKPNHLFLGEMAYQMCEEETQEVQTKMKGKMKREYAHGKQWVKMMRDMGGEGVIWVFIFGSITSKSVIHTYTDFQRAAMVHVVNQLPSIQNLIKEIGPGTLEDFCKRGQMSVKATRRIEACTGPEVVFVESEFEEGEDESGEE
ncbi:MAG: hypothetical protein Q9174_006489, partial [Haloplaca sp. 1 TL-2023]